MALLVDSPAVGTRVIARRCAAAVAAATAPRQSVFVARIPEASRVALKIREKSPGVIELVRKDNGLVFLPCATREIALQLQRVFSP